MALTVDRVVEDIDTSMRTLRASLRGIPFRAGGFHNTHDQLAREMAHLVVLLDAARVIFRR